MEKTGWNVHSQTQNWKTSRQDRERQNIPVYGVIGIISVYPELRSSMLDYITLEVSEFAVPDRMGGTCFHSYLRSGEGRDRCRRNDAESCDAEGGRSHFLLSGTEILGWCLSFSLFPSPEWCAWGGVCGLGWRGGERTLLWKYCRRR